MSYRNFPPPPPPPVQRPRSEPPQFAFHPQRTPFAPPPLLQEESSGTAFLAELADLSIPPVLASSNIDPQGAYVVRCNCCNETLTGRPRVHCLECKDYDVCSSCFTLGEVGRGHRKTHSQQTLKPPEYPQRHRRSRGGEMGYQCSVCYMDLTNEPRARCAQCKNYDLCLDCNLTCEVSMKHRASHDVNIITSHLDADESLILMGADYQPTPRLERLLDAVFEYIDASYAPRNTALIEPAKISAFYSSIGVAGEHNIGRFRNQDISTEYSVLGCEYHLVSDNMDEIQARSKPWSIDGLDTTPRSPALTRAGWIRFFVMTTWKNPDLMYYVLSNALSSGKVIHKKKSEPYRLSVPRECFPKWPRPARRPESGYR